MIRSMTGFARHEGEGEWGHALWELRSVNHRYLEVAVRLPEELRSLESTARERVTEHLRRGKVDCTLRYGATSGSAVKLTVNEKLVTELAKASREIDGLVYNPAPVNSLELLRWPGVLEVEPPDPQAIGGPLMELLDTALKTLVETREREGGKLKTAIEQRCAEARSHLAKLREQLPAITQAHRERLLARAKELGVGLEEGRLEQEMLLLAQRMDVSEEIDRLDTHLDEVLRVLAEPQPVGRRLDFLMQEMNREANTLGAKSVHADTTSVSVELKVLIEQMREQVQNVE